MSEWSPAVEARIAELKEADLPAPNKMAAICAAMVPELVARRDAATGRERKQLSSRLKTARMMLKWSRTRVGYDVTIGG